MKILLILALIIIGLCNRHHVKPAHQVPVHSSAPTVTAKREPVNPELLKNAERLAETLRRCKQTAHNNRETQ